MKVKKGDKLTVTDKRKGTYDAVALEAFDTEKDEWYPVKLDQESVDGLSSAGKWVKGDEIPARKGLCTIKVRK